MGLLKNNNCYALDMDGTVYLGERWIDGALDFLAALKKKEKQYVFLTNNSSKSVADYQRKLTQMGLEVAAEEIITSGLVTIAYLKREFPGKKVFLLGNEALRGEFDEAGIKLSDESPEVVVVAFDTTLDYIKMTKVCDFVRTGLPYISTHPDTNCPTETGFVPDAGAIHAFIHASAYRYPDHVIGKPNREIIDFMLTHTGAEREKTVIVGDRLYTDIRAGVDNGLMAVLVLSGEAKMVDVEAATYKPDLIFSSIKEMVSEI
ncbi:MAG: HAD-IIA family hydrolase [Lachnospiraceae bacterium]|jgi:HAD superfamily hydrolase (TIGR01457 family)|nr:HAD-IIA family hydrolase [Lachnospiraceae bacterium]